MVVLVEPYCGHSNRLFQTVHLEAFCREHDLAFFNPTFCQMPRVYNYAPQALLSRFYLRMYHSLKLKRLLKPVAFESFDSSEQYASLLLASRHRILHVGGWGFRAQGLTQKHRDYFRRRYGVKKATPELARIRGDMRKHKLCIGVHIRRGDYLTFEGGRFFYGDEVYREYLEKVLAIVGCQSLLVLLFSDEPVEAGSIVPSGVPYIVSRNEYYIDHTLMSECSLLLGPPSTFTMWASYVGVARYYHIRPEVKTVTMADFIDCSG